MPHLPRAIIFDLDDTLYPEASFICSGLRAVAAWAGERWGEDAECVYSELQKLHTQGPRGRLFDAWLAARQRSRDHLPTMIAVYREHHPQIHPYPDVVPWLVQFESQVRLGLLSDGYLSVQRRKWEALQLNEYFHAVVFSDQWGKQHWKPAPKGYRAVLAQLGVAAGEAVYVADNPEKDFLGARAVGLRSIRMRRAEGLHGAIEPAEPRFRADAQVANYDELRALLLSGWTGGATIEGRFMACDPPHGAAVR